ncbi:VOC family protein [Streptomyces sp. NBC_01476]|uniref:VOC family protein n=1 Tax=Streptomyces sp. NBC_01476 TaxID=2903881 RepID=UPI002E33E660|nr:VOC family protein [Streptomyces sp. NBC_01476]
MPPTPAPKLMMFLAFRSDAEEALEFYTSLFENSEVHRVVRARAGETGWEEGTLQHALFTLDGQTFMCTNMPPPGAKGYELAAWDAYAFSPATAIYVQCGTAEEFDRFYASLSEKGEVIMPADSYEFSARFAWVTDRFGVSWRINLAPSRRARRD